MKRFGLCLEVAFVVMVTSSTQASTSRIVAVAQPLLGEGLIEICDVPYNTDSFVPGAEVALTCEANAIRNVGEDIDEPVQNRNAASKFALAIRAGDVWDGRDVFDTLVVTLDATRADSAAAAQKVRAGPDSIVAATILCVRINAARSGLPTKYLNLKVLGPKRFQQFAGVYPVERLALPTRAFDFGRIPEQEGASTRDALRMVRGHWDHGIPYGRAQDLGAAALPDLYRLLRDPGERKHWHNAVSAIAFIGEESSFDSLHSFMWGRFAGEVDQDTFRALMAAQAGLGTIASRSAHAFGYLKACVYPAAWKNLRWHYKSYKDAKLAELLRSLSIQTLSLTPSAQAGQELQALRKASIDGPDRMKLDSAIKKHHEVYSLGLREYMHQVQGGE